MGKNITEDTLKEFGTSFRVGTCPHSSSIAATRHRPLSRHKLIVLSSRVASVATRPKLECTCHGDAGREHCTPPPHFPSSYPYLRRRRYYVTMSGYALFTQFIFVDGERTPFALLTLAHFGFSLLPTFMAKAVLADCVMVCVALWGKR